MPLLNINTNPNNKGPNLNKKGPRPQLGPSLTKIEENAKKPKIGGALTRYNGSRNLGLKEANVQQFSNLVNVNTLNPNIPKRIYAKPTSGYVSIAPSAGQKQTATRGTSKSQQQASEFAVPNRRTLGGRRTARRKTRKSPRRK